MAVKTVVLDRDVVVRSVRAVDRPVSCLRAIRLKQASNVLAVLLDILWSLFCSSRLGITKLFVVSVMSVTSGIMGIRLVTIYVMMLTSMGISSLVVVFVVPQLQRCRSA